MVFPYMFHLWGQSIHPHMLFEMLAYFLGFCVYFFLRRRFGDPIYTPLRWVLLGVALSGALVGSKLLYWLENPQLTRHNLGNPAYLLGGKTIVGALALGLVAVELSKRYLGIRRSTGDLYAIPLALGIAMGRVGCFLSGLEDNTYGTPTKLVWGVDFGDGIRRHPTQLYEVVFLLGLIPMLYRILRSVAKEREETSASGKVRGSMAGDVFKLFLVSYASFRLLADFLKPYPRILGLGAIQWVSLLILLYYSSDILRWFRGAGNQRLTRDST